jgi:hypothetical protein
MGDLLAYVAIAVVCFWLGFFTSAMLFVARHSDEHLE